jgi:V8-like Glu-specific endopeptidase
MFKYGRLVGVALVLTMLVSMLPLQVLASEGPNPPQTVVFKDGRVLSLSEVGDLGEAAQEARSGLIGIEAERVPVNVNDVTQTEKVFANAGSVFPPDSRYLVFRSTDSPNSAIAFLVVAWPDGTFTRCTGWIFGLSLVATSGHCVYDPIAGVWADEVQIFAGLSENLIPVYGNATAITRSAANMAVMGGWAAGNTDYDAGVLVMEPVTIYGAEVPLGLCTGAFAYRTHVNDMGVGKAGSDMRPAPLDPRHPNQMYRGKHWTMGYANDLPFGYMYKTHNDKAIWGTSQESLVYFLDTGAGWDGAPIYQDWIHWQEFGFDQTDWQGCWGREGGQCWPTVVAIHQGASMDSDGCRSCPMCSPGACARVRDGDVEIANRGIRITTEVAAFLDQMRMDYDGGWPTYGGRTGFRNGWPAYDVDQTICN